MANQDPLSRSLHFHHASAFGVGGQIDRPEKQTIPTQAAIALAPTGGKGSDRVENFKVPGVLSFSAAYVEVGGSLDDSHDTHTTYALSVVEDLNICDVVKADRVVSRLTIYSGAKDAKSEPSFSLSGSHFENLRIAGHSLDVKLGDLSQYDTYGSIDNNSEANRWQLGSNIKDEDLNKEEVKRKLEHNLTIVSGVAKRFQQWQSKTFNPADRSFWCSAVERSNLEELIQKTDLMQFGGILCVPRFGVIYLAELRIHRSHRHFNMIRVQMCSPGEGGITGGGTGGGGGSMPPP